MEMDQRLSDLELRNLHFDDRENFFEEVTDQFRVQGPILLPLKEVEAITSSDFPSEEQTKLLRSLLFPLICHRVSGQQALAAI